MFSLQTIFGKGDRFYGLLEAASDAAVQSAGALRKLVEDHGTAATLTEFKLARQREKEISAQISQELVDTFVTALEREDIEALGNAIYRIPKTIEKFADRYVIAGEKIHQIDFGQRAAMLEEATRLVADMMRGLRKMRIEPMKQLYDRLRNVEAEADRLILEMYRDLYSGKYDGLQALLIKEFFELLEKAIDRCREAGVVAYQIVLKNS
ncbi:MAG: pit accessory protein [Lysobacteraceae bacterium]